MNRQGRPTYESTMAAQRASDAEPKTWHDHLFDFGFWSLLIGVVITKLLMLGVDRRFKTGRKGNVQAPSIMVAGPILMLAGCALLLTWCNTLGSK